MDRIKILEQKIKDLEDQLTETTRYKDAIEAAGFDIWENNFATKETFGTNEKLFRSLGYTEEELPKNLEATFEKIHPDDLKLALEKVESHVNGETNEYKTEMRILAKDDSYVWIGSYGKILEKNEQGEITRFVGITFNIDERRIMEETLKTLAYTDSLTGLGNRRNLLEVTNHEIYRSKRHFHPISMMIIDVDDFKSINDQYGHLKGDEVLFEVGQCFNKIIRNTDLKVRYGGDEFAVLLLDTDIEKAFETAERLRLEISNIDVEIPIKFTVSIGISELEPSDTFETFFQRADEALYKAKKLGRNKIILM